MAVVHITKVFAIAEARVSKMLTDPSGAPPATYAASVKLPGAQKLTISGTINSKFLRGDNQLLDADAVWDSLSGSIDYSKLSLDALAVFFSSTVVDSGVTPNQLATMTMRNTHVLQYFRLEARSFSADPISGDVLYSIPKCKLASFPPLGLAEEDYQRTALNFNIIPTLADGSWLIPSVRETAVVLQ
jgi:hypothetical protein